MSVVISLLIFIALPRSSNFHDSFEQQQPSFTTMYYNPLQPLPLTVSSSPFLSFVATTSSSSTRPWVRTTTPSPLSSVTTTSFTTMYYNPLQPHPSTVSSPFLAFIATTSTSSTRPSVTATTPSPNPLSSVTTTTSSTPLVTATASTSSLPTGAALVSNSMPCDVNSWSPWSFCNAPCGFGRQTREAIFETPDCDPFVQERQCEADMPCQRDDPAGSTPGQDIVAVNNETEVNSTEISFVAIFEEFCQNFSRSSFPASNGEYAHNNTESFFTHAARSLLCFLAGFADNLFRSPPYFSSRRKMFQLMKRIKSGKFAKQSSKRPKHPVQSNKRKQNKRPSAIKGTVSALKKRNIKGGAQKKSVGRAGKKRKLSPNNAGAKKLKGKLLGSSKQRQVFPKSGPKFGTSPKNSAAAGSRPNQKSKFGGGGAPKGGQGSAGFGKKQSLAQTRAKQKPKLAKFPNSGIGSKRPGKQPAGSKRIRPNQMGGSGSPRNKLGLGGLGRPINILKSGNKTQN